MRMRTGMLVAILLAAAACQDSKHAASAAQERVRFTAGTATGQFMIELGPGETLDATQIGPTGGAMVSKEPGSPPIGLAVAIGASSDGAAIIGYSVDSENKWTAPDRLCGAAPTTGVAILYRDDAPDVFAAFTGDALGGEATVMCGLREVWAEEPPLTAIQ